MSRNPSLNANAEIEAMAVRHMAANPGQDWTLNVPFFWQRQILGDSVTLADEGNGKGRGCPVVDLFCPNVGDSEVIHEPRWISVKMTGLGKSKTNRRTGRTAILTTGTEDHVGAVIARMMEPGCSIPLLFCHRNGATGEWVQTCFDVADLFRKLVALDGPGDYDGVSPAMHSTGKRGVPVVVRQREQRYKAKVYTYDQVRINMAPLIKRGLVPDWREVDQPTLEWGE